MQFLNLPHRSCASEGAAWSAGSVAPPPWEARKPSSLSRPGALLPGYADREAPVVGGFPVAEYVHATTLKLPVWHREDDVRLADAYTAAIAKVADHHKDLL